MAFGFTAKYDLSISVENATPQEIIVRGIEAAKTLGWNIGKTTTTGFLAYTKLNLASHGEEFSIKIEGSAIALKSQCIGDQIIDWGKNKTNVERFIQEFDETEGKFTPEAISETYVALNVAAEGTDEGLVPSPQSGRSKVNGFLSIFVPVEGYFITPIVIDLNLLIFILMIAGGANIMLPDNDTLLAFGANFKPLTLAGQWWRLFSCCFVHIGVLHLLMNMYALMYIGLMIEPYLGKDRFTAAYLLTGLTASMTSLYWHDFTVSAGASGAIFGMYGVFLAMLTTNLIEKSARQAMLTSISIFVGYNLLNGIRGGIDNAAHIGGLVGGLIIGYAYIPCLRKPAEDKIKNLTLGLVITVVVGASALVYMTMPDGIVNFEQRMGDFSNYEDKALSYYAIAEAAPKEQLPELRDSSMYYWKQCVAIMKETDDMDLPEEIRTRNIRLKQYCDYRVALTDLFFKALIEDSKQYDEEMNAKMEQINIIVNELSGKHGE